MTDATTAAVEFAIACYIRLHPDQIDWELAILRERAILYMEREGEYMFAAGPGETLEVVV